MKSIRSIFHFGSLGRASDPRPLPKDEIETEQIEKGLSKNEEETITPHQLDQLLSADFSQKRKQNQVAARH